MLRVLRRHSKKVMGFVLAGLCISLMAAFGITGNFDDSLQDPIAIRVDDREIKTSELSRHYSQMVANYRRQLGEHFDKLAGQLNLKQQAIDSLISDVLLTKFTATQGFTAGQKAIEARVLENPFFRGKYDQQVYGDFLRAAGLTALQLEVATKNELVREQLRALFSDLSVLTEAELKGVYREQNTAVELEYIEIEAKKFEDKVDTADEEKLKAYLLDHQNEYQKPKQVRYSFIKFSPAKYQDKVEILEEDLLQSYKERQSQFVEPKQVHLRQIVLNIPKEDESSPLEKLALDSAEQTKETGQSKIKPKDLVREKAEGILAKLDAGEEFKKLVLEFSEDKTSKEKDGDLGWIVGGKDASPTELQPNLLPQLRQAAFSLPTGDHSEVLEADGAFYILQAEEVKESRQKSFEEVRAILESEIRMMEAPLYSYDAASDFYRRYKEQASSPGASESTLETLAQAENVTFVPVGEFLAAGQEPTGVPPGLTAQVLVFDAGARELIEHQNEVYVVSVAEVKEPYVPELNEVREQVVAGYVKDTTKSLTQEFANKLVLEAMGSAVGDSTKPEPQQAEPAVLVQKLSAIAATHKLEVKTSAKKTRETAHDGVFMVPEVRNQAFSLTPEKSLLNRAVTDGNTYYVVTLKSKELPSETDFASKKNELAEQEKNQAQSRLFETLLSTLRAEAVVDVETKASDRI